jgi:hypothetical protein
MTDKLAAGWQAKAKAKNIAGLAVLVVRCVLRLQSLATKMKLCVVLAAMAVVVDRLWTILSQLPAQHATNRFLS